MSSKKKGKPSKLPKKENPASTAQVEQEENQESAEERFEQELNWCIEQIVLGFAHQNPNSKQAYEAVKILKILRSDKAPMIKKRQAMRNAFGDYRQKMKAEERKTVAKLKKVSLTQVKDIPGENSCFFKKSLNKQGKCQTIVKDTNSELEKEDSNSESKTLTGSNNDVPNKTGSDFKFNRSNNAFTFNFDQQHKDGDNTDSTGLDNFVNGLNLNTGDCVSESNEEHKSINDAEMTEKTLQKDFKMIKTDNSFRFNFPVQES